MKKEVIVVLVSIAVLLILVLRTHFSDESSTFEPRTYYLTDFPEETKGSRETDDIKSKNASNSSTKKVAITSPELVHSSKKAETNESKDVTSKKNTPKKEVTEENTPEKKVPVKKVSKKTQTHAPLFKIQLFVSYHKLPAQSKQFKGLDPVDYYKVKNIYKYTYGSDTDYNKIKELKSSIVDSKFKDAFIIAFKDGEKMDLDEAIEASGATD